MFIGSVLAVIGALLIGASIVLGQLPLWGPRTTRTYQAVGLLWLGGLAVLLVGFALTIGGPAAEAAGITLLVLIATEIIWSLPSRRRLLVTGETRVVVTLPPADVFSRISDRVAANSANPAVVSCEALDPGPLRPGSRWRYVMRQGRFLVTVIETIRACAPDSELTVINDTGATTTFAIVPHEAGSIITTSYTLTVPLISWLMGAVLPWRRRRTAAGIEAAYRESAARLEARLNAS